MEERLFCLPYKAHWSLLHLLCEDLPIEAQLFKRAIKFFRSIVKSENNIIQLCGRLASRGSQSKVSNTINYVCSKYKMTKEQIICEHNIKYLDDEFNCEILNACLDDKFRAGNL